MKACSQPAAIWVAFQFAVLLALTGCTPQAATTWQIPSPPVPSSNPVETPPALLPSPGPVVTSTPAAVASMPPTTSPAAEVATCSTVDPITAFIVDQITPDRWLSWVKQLSGAEPVRLGGKITIITSRTNPVMFGGYAPSAFDFTTETLRAWYPEEQISIQAYADPAPAEGRPNRKGKNLILTLPGNLHPDEQVLLTAHLDSTARGDGTHAPGADDNASGAAALIETARLLAGHRPDRTIRLIWFTGEEVGLLGSQAYVKNHVKDPHQIIGVVNLDMLGYDPQDDRCFELHVGELAQSARVGQCFGQSINAYGLDLHYDFLTSGATHASDHSSFWAAGVGAVEVLENHFTDRQPSGCPSGLENPYHHTLNDTFDHLNPETAVRIIRAAVATVLAMAGGVE